MVTDEFGRHELLDRAGNLQELIDGWLLDHGGLLPDEKVLAEKAGEALAELYLLIGKRHLGASEIPEGKS